jgi:hypothetical protein
VVPPQTGAEVVTLDGAIGVASKVLFPQFAQDAREGGGWVAVDRFFVKNMLQLGQYCHCHSLSCTVGTALI